MTRASRFRRVEIYARVYLALWWLPLVAMTIRDRLSLHAGELGKIHDDAARARSPIPSDERAILDAVKRLLLKRNATRRRQVREAMRNARERYPIS